jgi:hypothetical protein
MTTDQIVDEVRAACAALLQAAGGTLDGLLDFLTREEAARRANGSLADAKSGRTTTRSRRSARHLPEARLNVQAAGRGTSRRVART